MMVHYSRSSAAFLFECENSNLSLSLLLFFDPFVSAKVIR